MKYMRILGILFVAALATAAQANATPTLQLTQGATIITVADGGVGDANPLAGVVTWIGSIGTYDINVTTGVAVPAGATILDLNSVDISTGFSGGGGTLVIEFSQTGFTNLLGFAAAIGGTVGPPGSSVTADVYTSATNLALADDDLVCSLGPFTATTSPFAFAGTCSGPGASSSPFSITQTLTINLAGPGSFSGDFDLTHIPEPATMFLVGGGILAGLRHRRKNAAKNAAR